MRTAVGPEGHCQGAEIPDDGPQHPEPLDAKDQIEATQVECETVNGEGLAANGGWSSEADTRAAHPVAIGHHDAEAGAWRDGETQALRNRGVDERVGGARVHQRPELDAAHYDLQ